MTTCASAAARAWRSARPTCCGCRRRERLRQPIPTTVRGASSVRWHARSMPSRSPSEWTNRPGRHFVRGSPSWRRAMATDRNPIALDGRRLTVADVDAVADGALVELDATALERVAAGHRTLLEVIERGTPIYAVTRGTGQFWSRTSTLAEREQTARSAGRNRLLYGERLGVRTGRAVMLATINGMLGGRTGVRPEYVEHVAAMLNAGITPV